MKYAPIFAFFCLFSFNLHAQSTAPPTDLVMGEEVPDYLRNAIASGRVKVNGVQTSTAEGDVDQPRKAQPKNSVPRLLPHPQSVVYLRETIMGNHEVETDQCFPPPNVVQFLKGIRGAAFGNGGVTAEDVIIGSDPKR